MALVSPAKPRAAREEACHRRANSSPPDGSWNAMRKNVAQGVTDKKESGSPQQHRRQLTQQRPYQRIG